MINRYLIDELNRILSKFDIREFQEINSCLFLKEFENLSLELSSYHRGMTLILSLVDEIIELKREIKMLKESK